MWSGGVLFLIDTMGSARRAPSQRAAVWVLAPRGPTRTPNRNTQSSCDLRRVNTWVFSLRMKRRTYIRQRPQLLLSFSIAFEARNSITLVAKSLKFRSIASPAQSRQNALIVQCSSFLPSMTQSLFPNCFFYHSYFDLIFFTLRSKRSKQISCYSLCAGHFIAI